MDIHLPSPLMPANFPVPCTNRQVPSAFAGSPLRKNAEVLVSRGVPVLATAVYVLLAANIRERPDAMRRHPVKRAAFYAARHTCEVEGSGHNAIGMLNDVCRTRIAGLVVIFAFCGADLRAESQSREQAISN